MSYEFQNVLYPTQMAMYAAIAEEWITGAGSNSEVDILRGLQDYTDHELAADCKSSWDTDDKWSMDWLVEAFSNYRDEHAPADSRSQY